MTIEKEVIFEFNKMVLEHTDALWKVASALIVLEVLMIAHILKVRHITGQRKWISWVLFASAFFNGVSVACGYLSNAVMISSMQRYAETGDWLHDKTAEWFTLIQMGMVSAGIAVFLLAFYFYSDILANIMTQVGASGG